MKQEFFKMYNQNYYKGIENDKEIEYQNNIINKHNKFIESTSKSIPICCLHLGHTFVITPFAIIKSLLNNILFNFL